MPAASKANASGLDKAKQECQALLRFLMDQPDIEPFSEPVDWKGLGLDDYLEVGCRVLTAPPFPRSVVLVDRCDSNRLSIWARPFS